MINSRKKGIKWELYIIKMFKTLGFEKAASTRATSRFLDNLEIDINNIPFWVQVKSGKQYVNPIALLKRIKKNIIKHNLENKPTMLIRIYDTQKGKMKQETDFLVYFLKDNFEMFYPTVKFNNIKEVTGTNNSNYKKLLSNYDIVFRNVEDGLYVFTLNTLKLIINGYKKRT